MSTVRAFMARVDFQVLGALQAGPNPNAVRGQRARDVLALLVLRRGRPLSPELILDAVWADDAHRLDASVVHTVIARLRRALGHASITRHDQGYHLARDIRVDADEFTRLVTAAQAMVPERHGEIVELLRRALALWTGPEAYAGVSDALVATDRPRLHELRDTATEQLAERLLAAGSPARCADAILLAGDLVGREPLRERAHELLMEALYRTGRQGEALAVYDALRRALRDELGIDPSPATADLHARILAQDIAPAPRLPPRPARGIAPRPRTVTVGRDAELQALADEVTSGRPLITIVGPGGVGKSRLLAEFAARRPPQPAMVYAELPATADATVAEVAETIARAAGLTLAPGDPLDAVVAGLGTTDRLLLLDEAEWALAATVEVVSAILARCAGTRIVVTSRTPLDLVGERRILLRPLAAPAPGSTLAQTRAAPAVALLLDRLGDHAPDLELSPVDVGRVGEITRRVDGLPLALEIVAGQAATMSVADLLALGDAPLDLESAERDRGQRQRTLRETLTWSIERLTPAARTVLCQLGVFAGSFDMAAAEAIVGRVPPGADGATVDVPAVVRTLIREAQLQIDRGDGTVRIRMLRSVQTLARERLSESGGDAAVRQRHRRWYAARWRDRPLTDALVLDVSASYGDYLAALNSALAEADRETLGDLAIVLSRYWFLSRPATRGCAWSGLPWPQASSTSGTRPSSNSSRRPCSRKTRARPSAPDSTGSLLRSPARGTGWRGCTSCGRSGAMCMVTSRGRWPARRRPWPLPARALSTTCPKPSGRRPSCWPPWSVPRRR
ncbi:MAG: BTAD domain-containing putative transcriptional regulator [Tetrasphaera sp.]